MEKAQLEEEFYQWMKENIREMKGIEQISIFQELFATRAQMLFNKNTVSTVISGHNYIILCANDESSEMLTFQMRHRNPLLIARYVKRSPDEIIDEKNIFHKEGEMFRVTCDHEVKTEKETALLKETSIFYESGREYSRMKDISNSKNGIIVSFSTEKFELGRLKGFVTARDSKQLYMRRTLSKSYLNKDFQHRLATEVIVAPLHYDIKERFQIKDSLPYANAIPFIPLEQPQEGYTLVKGREYRDLPYRKRR